MEKIKKVFFIILGIFTAIIFMEMILHFTDKSSYDDFFYDKQTGLLLHKPNTDVNMASSCFKNNAHINSFGFYGPEISADKKLDEYRIIITGSSFVEGFQVPLSERFDTLLQNKLNENDLGKKYKVISIGFSGNGTFLDILYFKNYAAKLHPDLVINLMTDYDLKIDSPSGNHTNYFDEKGNIVTELPAVRRDSRLLFIKGMFRKSKLAMNLYYKYLFFKETIKQNINNETATSSPIISNSWGVENKLLDKFNDLVKSKGAKFLLVSWTENMVPDRNIMKDGLIPITKNNNIPYLDITSIMDSKEKNTGIKPTWECDGHWDKDGHVWVADVLFQYLKSNPSLL